MARELLTPAEMYRADALAVAAGIPSLTLMENAGRAVAEEIVRRYGARKTTVLCGPGNNGGDGFVCARYLKQWGWPVRVALYGERTSLKGDAAAMAAQWDDPILILQNPAAFGSAGEGNAFSAQLGPDPAAQTDFGELIVDALFGAGLSRDFPQALAFIIAAARVPIIAIDVPSGLDGATGRRRGLALRADLTVTFFRKKPGHVVGAGPEHCGEVVVAEIGIPESVLSGINPLTWENGPPPLRQPQRARHKYGRGHAIVVSGGPQNTGASRLAAEAALRIGAGVVTIAGHPAALAVHATHVSAIMLKGSESDWGVLTPCNAICIGLAAGVNDATRNNVEAILRHDPSEGHATRHAVLDADALSVFASDPEALFGLIAATPFRSVVMTPHEGEFSRLFRDLPPQSDSKFERARKAAARSGAIVVLKGPDTVIAHPDGRARINTNAPPSLATAGSGDVLAGMVTGLLAQGMDAFDAACAAVWLHGDAATRHGANGLTAESLVAAL